MPQDPKKANQLRPNEQEECEGHTDCKDRPAENEMDEEARKREEKRKRREKKYRELWRQAKDPERPNRHWTPWLLIRYSLTDLGLRPIPAGDAHWRSPDIWVESSDPLGRAVAGEENFVHARIFNLGMANAAPVKVDFYWANPALGLGPANMNLIGTEWVEVKSQRAVDVRCNTPWVPVFLNNGHECLKVNCSNHILDPIIHPFQPRLDRHAGQRNITVLEAEAGETVEFTLEVNNLFPVLAQATITARIEHVFVTNVAMEKLDHRGIINHVVAYGAVETNTPAEMMRRFREGTAEHRMATQVAKLASSRQKTAARFVSGVAESSRGLRSAACISSKLTDHSCILSPFEPGQYLGNLLLARDKLVSLNESLDVGGDVPLEDVSLKPFEQRRLALEFGIPADAKTGGYVVFHLTQRAEGLPVGGYAVVVKVVEQKCSKKKR